jgi:ATP-dependent DNA helicase RecG
MAPADKDDVMSAFANGRLDVLVATTVIEVGVDVPNATVMAVLDADRFGMSQLHQLRGRIGRGAAPGVCLLETSTEPGSPTHERLVKVASTVDGFELARFDLETRREGDVLGASQSGRRKFLKMLELSRHEELISQARDEATAIVAEDPDLSAHPALAQALADALDPERSEYLERA